MAFLCGKLITQAMTESAMSVEEGTEKSMSLQSKTICLLRLSLGVREVIVME